MYPIIEVSAGSAQTLEQLGTKDKFWFLTPGLGWRLCKLKRPNTGEDWSEKVAAEIAAGLDLPHALYELGVFEGRECVLSTTCVPEGWTLVHGNEPLGEFDPGYGTASRYRETAHTLEAVWNVLRRLSCDLPVSWTPPSQIRSAVDVFVGYLLLDAIVGNTDRHHENWAVVDGPPGPYPRRHLAPTYDHASCLGCHLTDRDRIKRLATRDRRYTPEAYSEKARSAFFLDPTAQQPLLTGETFRRAAASYPLAASVWLTKLRSLPLPAFEGILASVPSARCSRPSLDFARRVLLHNRERLLSWAEEQ